MADHLIADRDTAAIRFLSYVRAGLAQRVTQAEAIPGPSAAALQVAVTVGPESGPAQTVSKTLRLQGPGRVTGIDPAEVVAVQPTDGSVASEPNYFPSVTLSSPDLPWRYTPFAPPAGTTRLRPWMVLICVEQKPGVTLRTGADQVLPILEIGGDASPGDELPDLADSWAWAHVHCTEDFADETELAIVLAERPAQVTSRLVCPRQLSPNTSYLACLVPAFDVGVAAGLGIDGPVPAALDHAWTGGEDSVQLPVLHSWSFATADEGDFESLVRKVDPVEAPPDVGVKDLDLSTPGPGLPTSDPDRFRGVLASPAADPGDWDDATFGAAIATRYAVVDASQDEPVIGLPDHGSLQAGPVSPWRSGLNETPSLRAAAGLGAEIVRRNQEAFMAEAWDQARAFTQAQVAVSRAALAGWVATRVADKAKALPAVDLVQVASLMMPRIAGQTGPGQPPPTAAAALGASAVPRGLVSTRSRRALRPAGQVAKVASRTASTVVAAGEVVRGVARDVDLAAIAGVAVLADGSIRRDATQILQTHVAGASPAFVATSLDGLADFAAGLGHAGPLVITTPRPSPSGGVVASLPQVLSAATTEPVQALQDAADAVIQAMAPTAVIAARLAGRITGLDALTSTRVPTAVGFAPVFDEPLHPHLAALGTAFVVPGMAFLGRDEATLLEVQPDVIEAILVGANHEMARELRWREFPARRGATFFQRFWEVEPTTAHAERPDVEPINEWRAVLGANMRPERGRDSLVLAVKAELIERHPDVLVWAAQAEWNGEEHRQLPASPARVDPNFTAPLGRDVVIWGLPIPDGTDLIGSPDPDDKRPGWFIVLEERPSGDRFGLDATQAGGSATWADVSWPEVVAGGHVVDGHLRLAGDLDGQSRPGAPDDDGQDMWGRDASDMARITYQEPVRVLVHASQLIAVNP